LSASIKIPDLDGARPAIAILGHGGHGKDAAAAILARLCGLKVSSSSKFCAARAVYPLVKDLYADAAACYRDRRNHRALWFHAITAYGFRPGPSLTEQILAENHIYVGPRNLADFMLSRHLFNLVIWVDRSEILPPEPVGSMELSPDLADWFLDNNRTLDYLEAQILERLFG